MPVKYIRAMAERSVWISDLWQIDIALLILHLTDLFMQILNLLFEFCREQHINRHFSIQQY